MIEPSILLPNILFYCFASLMVIFALMVITLKNPVHAVLSLIFVFFNAAGLFVMLGAEFVGMLMVIVYVGAVAVLFLFVVMMLNVNFAKLRGRFVQYVPIVSLVAMLMLVELIAVIYHTSDIIIADKPIANPIKADGLLTNTEQLGLLLYTDYIFAFQLSGIILLVAMIGAMVLTIRTREGVKRQSIQRQVTRDARSSIKMVNIESGKGVSQ